MFTQHTQFFSGTIYDMWLLKQYTRISFEGGWSLVSEARTMCYVSYRNRNEIVSEVACCMKAAL
jgi:hypothetical protein